MHLIQVYSDSVQIGSSPHTRGAHPRVLGEPEVIRIIPAYAGCTSVYLTLGAISWDHPRIRGVHRAWDRSGGNGMGSSPHTRGAPLGEERGDREGRIIPAYAGCTRSILNLETATEDHPRIRGVHSLMDRKVFANCGSSPHTRGAPAPSATAMPGDRIIPAYAGCT